MISLLLGVALATTPDTPSPLQPLTLDDIDHGAPAPEPPQIADSMSNSSSPTSSTVKVRRTRKELPRYRAPGFHLDLRAVTNLPTDLGGGISIETPFRVQLSMTAGIMPEFYQGITEATYGAIADPIRDGIGAFHQTVDTSLFLNPEIAIRPSQRGGFVLAGGYRWLRLSSETGTTGSIARSAGVTIPDEYNAYVNTPWIAHTTLHQATAHIGWEFFISRIVVRLDLGGAFTIQARSSVEAKGNLPAGLIGSDWLSSAELFADEALRKYGHTPTVGVTLGYRLF